MATAKELFYNSYLKKMKRPEFQREFNPDDVFGANSVARSERTNPWAGRDSSNAKFGFLGGNNQGGGDQGGMNQSEGLSMLPELLNKGTEASKPTIMPMSATTSGGDQSALGTLGIPLAGYGGKLLGGSIADWLQGPDKYSELSPMMQGYAEGVSDIGKTITPVDSGMDLGGYDKLLSNMMEPAQDELASTITGAGAETGAEATGSIPYAGAGLKTISDLLTGKMFRRPAESIGGTGGMLGGAALGSMIFPGVGTALGGLLGGTGGGLLGKWFGRLFR